MQATPFRLLGDGTLRAVQSSMARATSNWAAEWGVDAAQLRVGVARAWEAASDMDAPDDGVQPWTRAAHFAGRTTWIGCADESSGQLHAALFGEHVASNSTMAARMATTGTECARAALFGELCRSALSSHQLPAQDEYVDLPEVNWKRGGGAVLVLITVGRWQCRVLLDSNAVQALVPPPADLGRLHAVDYGACLAEVPVTLQLSIGAARLCLGSLLTICEGDVIGLGASSDAPFRVTTLDGQQVLGAFLGRCGDSLAIEVVPNQTTSTGRAHE